MPDPLKAEVQETDTSTRPAHSIQSIHRMSNINIAKLYYENQLQIVFVNKKLWKRLKRLKAGKFMCIICVIISVYKIVF